MEEFNMQIYGCRKCRLWQGAKHAVPGEGPSNARIMVVGQNPGAEEDEVGRPFVGRAGKYLGKALIDNGFNRQELFITNIVKHKTPKNRVPFSDEITACLPYLTEQIAMIKPEKIILLGKAAYKETPRIDGIKYFEVVHPQAASRFPKMDKKFKEQLKSLQE